jgi:hypothetical protein
MPCNPGEDTIWRHKRKGYETTVRGKHDREYWTRTSEGDKSKERENRAERGKYAPHLMKTPRSHRHLTPPQIHHLLPASITLRIRKHLSQMLDTRVELLCTLLAIKVKRDITHARSPDTQQPHGHGQVYPGLPGCGQDSALLATRLEHGGVFGAGEDENRFEGLDGEESAENRRR